MPAPTWKPPTAHPHDVRADLARDPSARHGDLARRDRRPAHRRAARRRVSGGAGTRARGRRSPQPAGRSSRRAAEVMRPLAPPLEHRRSRAGTLGSEAGRGTADARARDQRRPSPRHSTAIRRRSSSARTSRPRAGSTASRVGCTPLRRGPRLRHAARRDVDPRPRPRGGGDRASCRCPRSSTSRTSTTPRTSSAARRRRCSSSRRGQYRNGMVVRIAGYGYQKGFGGHFHNDDSVAVLRDIPGLVIAVPGTAATTPRRCYAPASPRRRSTAASARSSSRSRSTTRATCTRRATSPGSQHRRSDHVPLGSARTYGDGDDLTILTWGNGLLLSLRVAPRLEARGHRRTRRRPALARAASDRGHRAGGGGHAAGSSSSTRRGGPAASRRASSRHSSTSASTARMARVASKDSFVPLGDAARLVLALRGGDRGGGALALA